MDLYGPLTDKIDNSGSPFLYILVIKELWLGLAPLRNTTTEAIAQAIYSDIILPFANFKNLCSDNTAKLTTLAVKETCHLLSIKSRKLYAYQAATNSKIEQTMAVIRDAFRKFRYERLGPCVEGHGFSHKFEPKGPYTVQTIFPSAFPRVPFYFCLFGFHRG